MKFSALILLSILPAAIAVDEVAVRIVGNDIPPAQVQVVQAAMEMTAGSIESDLVLIAGSCATPPCRALAGQDRIDTKMAEVKEVSAPELPTPADPDHHRALRGQNRELQSCSVLCSGLPPPCRVSCLSRLRQ